MAEEPIEVRIRMYNVGFGDCFLLTFVYADHPPHPFHRHVLIDFGTMGLPKRNGKRLHSTADIADHIAAECAKGELTAVVATHRHQDHISGFAGSSGATIQKLAPKLVVQPWTEQPDLDEHATAPSSHRETAKRFAAVNEDLEDALANSGLLFVTGRKRGLEYIDNDFDLDQLGGTLKRFGAAADGMAENAVRDVAFQGNNNIKNEAAVNRLAAMGREVEYLSADDQETKLERHLPGVRVHVLGPPTRVEADIESQAETNETEFWHLSSSAWGVGLRGSDFGDEPPLRFDPARSIPVECRWLASHIADARPRDLLAIVRDLDRALNNTSLILLFEVWSGGDRQLLLFPGDAQIESWKHCFKNPDHVALLEDVDVYKVGHHGSLNATPKLGLWRRFAKRGPDRRLVTLLSTCDGRHGHRENDTEVPRWKLARELRRHSRVFDSRLSDEEDESKFVDYVVRPGLVR